MMVVDQIYKLRYHPSKMKNLYNYLPVDYTVGEYVFKLHHALASIAYSKVTGLLYVNNLNTITTLTLDNNFVTHIKKFRNVKSYSISSGTIWYNNRDYPKLLKFVRMINRDISLKEVDVTRQIMLDIYIERYVKQDKDYGNSLYLHLLSLVQNNKNIHLINFNKHLINDLLYTLDISFFKFIESHYGVQYIFKTINKFIAHTPDTKSHAITICKLLDGQLLEKIEKIPGLMLYNIIVGYSKTHIINWIILMELENIVREELREYGYRHEPDMSDPLLYGRIEELKPDYEIVRAPILSNLYNITQNNAMSYIKQFAND